MAIILLVVALLLFLVSARQWTLPYRLLIWLLGALALVCAVLFVLKANHNGLFLAAMDFAGHWRDPSRSIVLQALAHNVGAIDRYVMRLVDLFLIFAAVIGIVSLLAFTRGERIERALRPSIIGVLGAIAGGAIALVVVGVGFGSPIRQSFYAAQLLERDIHDGDTLWIGEIAVRLNGVDAPELGQPCLRGREFRDDCGEWARQQLWESVDGRLVVCVPERSSGGRQRDSFGRVLASCTVGGQPLAPEALQAWAAPYQKEPTAEVVMVPSIDGSPACMHNPTLWRRARRAVEDALREGLRDACLAHAQRQS